MTTLSYTVADSATMLRRNLKHMRRYPAMTLMILTGHLLSPGGLPGLGVGGLDLVQGRGWDVIDVVVRAYQPEPPDPLEPDPYEPPELLEPPVPLGTEDVSTLPVITCQTPPTPLPWVSPGPLSPA
jgi:hypothetical protein